MFTNRILLVVPSFTPVYLSLKLGISYSKSTSAPLVHYHTSPTEPEAACEHAGEWQRESCPRIRQVLIPPVCRLFFCLLTRCRLLRHSEPRSRWCAEATRSGPIFKRLSRVLSLHSICVEASLLGRRRPWWSHLVSTQLTFALIRLRGVRCLAAEGRV